MNKKKMLSLFLACCMLVGMVPAALAAELEEETQTPPVEEMQQVQETPETTEEKTSVTTEMPALEDLIPDDESGKEPSLFSETPADTTEATDVAEIDGTKYQDFATALAAAKDGATLKLLADVELDKGITIGQEDTPQVFTLDLNGHTATVKAQIDICYASEMTIKDSGTDGSITFSDTKNADGEYTSFGRVVIFGNQTYHDGAKPEVKNAVNSTLVLESGIITSSSVQGTIGMFGNGATLHMTGGSVINTYKNESTDGAFAIAGNGTRKASEDDGGIKITIEGGEVKSAQDCAIYLPCYNDTTISGGTIEGWSGIEIDSGNLTITGGTIKSTYVSDGTRKYKQKGDGNYNFGAALAIVSKGAGNESKTGYYGNMNIDISGGTLVGGKYYAVDEYNLPHVQDSTKDNTGYFGEKGLTISGGTFTGGTDKGGVLSDTQKKFITGGTFSGDPSDYLADGYVAVKDEDGTYTVETFADTVSATLDVSKSGGITAEGSGKAFTLSGNVDMSKYTVTDSGLKTLFSGLLAKERKDIAELADNEEQTIETMYVKGGLDLVFAVLKFEGLSETGNYYIKQTNPGLNIGYPGAFENNVKGKLYSGKDISDGLAFIVPTGENTIKFEIAPCEDGAEALPDGEATVTINANVKLADAEPEAGTVVAPPKVTEDSNGNKSTTAKVEDSAVGSVASGSTLTVDATVSTNIDEDVVKSEVTLEKALVGKLNTANATLEIKTDVATVELPAEAVAKMKGGADDNGVVLSVEKKDATSATGVSDIFEVKVVKAKTTNTEVEIKDLTDEITLSFYIGPGRKDNPMLFFYDNGKYVPVDGSSYDDVTGYVTGTTRHLSEYRVRTADETADGLGRQITVYAEENQFVAVQVSRNGSNAIFSVEVGSGGAVTFTAPTGSIVSYWVTSEAPTFNGTGITNDASKIVQGQTFVGAKN